MKHLLSVALLPFIASLVACSTPTTAPQSSPNYVRHVDVSLSPDSSRETILLVSLEDGSVIMQTIHSSADLCFKMNTDSATTCLTQGAPVYDPATDSVIGFEMIEDQIELVAKSD
ncbi:MAG: hypothetical protein KJO09_04085 [Gammaproteobacteria bacterium]|nr:hypothetical protein [Gammaproteobacteria bacterium]